VVVVNTGRGGASDDDVDVKALERRQPRLAESVARAMAEDAIDSRAIFGDGKEVAIRHGDQLYRLRITRHGKLILNK